MPARKLLQDSSENTRIQNGSWPLSVEGDIGGAGVPPAFLCAQDKKRRPFLHQGKQDARATEDYRGHYSPYNAPWPFPAALPRT